MRELKFRSWDKLDRKMEPIADIDFLLGKAFVGFKLGERQYKHFPERIEILQYTGLKDRMDKPIFEGDIVELRTTDLCDCLDCDNTYKPARRVVSWRHCSFIINPHGGDTAVRVIGNIYETPELLNNQSK